MQGKAVYIGPLPRLNHCPRNLQVAIVCHSGGKKLELLSFLIKGGGVIRMCYTFIYLYIYLFIVIHSIDHNQSRPYDIESVACFLMLFMCFF